MAKRRVVITGAAGYVGQRMFKELAERWDVVPIDVIPATRGGEKVPGLIVADLTRPDRERVSPALPRRRRGHPSAGTCARRDGRHDVAGEQRRQVLGRAPERRPSPTTSTASRSRRACAGWSWPAPTTPPTTTSGWCGTGGVDMVTPEMPPRSDNWYGWAKAAYELLGFVFATGKVDGRKLEVVQWRIGGPRDDDIEHVKPGDIKVMHRALGAYLSRARSGPAGHPHGGDRGHHATSTASRS